MPHRAKRITPNATSTRDLTFLVVDDEPTFRELLSKMLMSFGAADVLTAETAEEGLRLIQSHKVDMVFSDVVMHGINGLRFVKMVRDMGLFDDSGRHAVPVVMITAHTERQVVAAAVKAGADGCLAKPPGALPLGRMISRLCGVPDPAAAAAARRRAG